MRKHLMRKSPIEEICDLRMFIIVKEVSEFTLKQLEHKSPGVKQKALRLIKYAMIKSGLEFKREMRRNSVAVCQLLCYRGQLGHLKGDVPNKAVRDTAQETISAIFSKDNKPAPTEDLNKRIQGFENTNFERPFEDQKFLVSWLALEVLLSSRGLVFSLWAIHLERMIMKATRVLHSEGL